MNLDLLRISKILSLLVWTVLFTACQKSPQFEKTTWDSNLSTKEIPQIQSQNWHQEPSVSTKYHQINFREQIYFGLPVAGTYLKWVDGLNSKPVFVEFQKLNLKQKKDWTLDIQMALSKKALITSYLKYRNPALKEYNFSEPELKFEFMENQIHLIWSVQGTDHLGSLWNIISDVEADGYRIEKLGSNFHESKIEAAHETAATVYPLGPQRSSLQDVVLKNLIEIENLVSPQINLKSAAMQIIKNSEQPLKFNPPDERFDQVQIFYVVTKALDWYKEKTGVTLVDPLDIQTQVGSPEKSNTAFYYSGKLRFGSGDGVNYDKIPLDPSIVIHETGHAIVDALSHLPYQNEGGSLNEALADFFAAVQLNNPNMGEVAYIKGPYKRTLAIPIKWNEKNAGLYHDSGIISSFLWDLKGILGSDRAVDVVVKTMAKITPGSDFSDFQQKLYEVLKPTLQESERAQVQKVIRDRAWPEI